MENIEGIVNGILNRLMYLKRYYVWTLDKIDEYRNEPELLRYYRIEARRIIREGSSCVFDLDELHGFIPRNPQSASEEFCRNLPNLNMVRLTFIPNPNFWSHENANAG